MDKEWRRFSHTAAAAAPPAMAAAAPPTPASASAPTSTLAEDDGGARPDDRREPRVRARVVGGSVLVWTVPDADRLRRVHGLAVSSVGPSLSAASIATRCGTLPVVLRPEEVFVATLHDLLDLDESDADDSSTSATSHSASAPSPMQVPDERTLLRCLVFHALWRDGFRLTNGLKFGADFLAYPDDPSKCHSPFLVLVRRRDALVAPAALLAWSRVANGSLKTGVFALVDLPDVTAADAEPGPGPAPWGRETWRWWVERARVQFVTFTRRVAVDMHG